jgi:hypothetical protein
MAAGEALGLIETKGITPAVEALDAALKAANVTFVDRKMVGNGLVAISVKGRPRRDRRRRRGGREARRSRQRPRHRPASPGRGEDVMGK